MKTCSICKKRMDYSRFYKSNSSNDGYYSQCRECARLIARQRSREHSSWKFHNKRYYKNWNPLRYIEDERYYMNLNVCFGYYLASFGGAKRGKIMYNVGRITKLMNQREGVA